MTRWTSVEVKDPVMLKQRVAEYCTLLGKQGKSNIRLTALDRAQLTEFLEWQERELTKLLKSNPLQVASQSHAGTQGTCRNEPGRKIFRATQ